GFGIEQTEAPSTSQKAETAYPSTASLAELISTTGRFIDDLAKADAFSGVVMIAKNGTPIFAKAYGYADAEKKLANTVDTRFNLGSINKNFTRIAIGQLVKQGKLSFDDKLIKILPDYPNRDAAAKITIGHLVNMTSGIGDFFNDKFDAIDKKKLRENKDYLPLFGSDPLEFEPGTKNRYSNAGYVVLGLVIEKISGKSYYDYVRDNIFKPAGMNSTDSYALDELPINTAFGYAGTAGARNRNLASLPGRGSSAGGGYSTATDLLKFSNALRNQKLTIPDDNGGFSATFNGVGIAGGSPGVNALFIANGQTGYTIIVLSNYGPPSAEKPGTQIRDWLKQIKE
ncbi:MAG: serine hydrolase domain-containing protein, partial [Pyrinomonadaceae bacterium]